MPFYNDGWYLPKIALGIMAQVGMPVSGDVEKLYLQEMATRRVAKSCLGWREVKFLCELV